MTGNDQDLRDRFAALRRLEETRAPGFAAMLKPSMRRVRRRTPATALAAAACLALTLAALLWLGRGFWNREFGRPHREQGTPIASITTWKSPTDFLLQTPGRAMLRTMPDLGFSSGESIVSGSAIKYQHQKRKALP